MISLAFSLSGDLLDPHPHHYSPCPGLLPRSQSLMITSALAHVSTEALFKKSPKTELQVQQDPGAQSTSLGRRVSVSPQVNFISR